MFSYHTHTLFCDGKATIDEFCLKAIECGFRDIAFTSHAPVPFDNNYSLKFEALTDYRDAVLKAKVAHGESLNVYFGFEADYTPNNTISFEQWRQLVSPDIIIGSVHFVYDEISGQNWFIDGAAENFVSGLEKVFQNDVQRAVKTYFKQVRAMISTQKPDIVGHIDKVKMNNRDRFFSPYDDWYLNEFEETLQCAKEFGCIVEINSRGVYRGKYHELFPHINGIKRCLELGIPLTLASDSHHPDELLMGYNLALSAAIEADVKELVVFNGDGWEPVDINELK